MGRVEGGRGVGGVGVVNNLIRVITVSVLNVGTCYVKMTGHPKVRRFRTKDRLIVERTAVPRTLSVINGDAVRRSLPVCSPWG